MMKNKILFVLGIVLIFITFNIGNKPKNQDVVDIKVPQVSQEFIQKTAKVSDIVTEPRDRLELCIFNKVFADRVINYNANQQDINDIYSGAAKIIFDDRLNDKYDGLAEFLTNLLHETTGEDVHMLSNGEKQTIQSLFYGVSSNLKKG